MIICAKCGSETITQLTPNTVHYGKIVCKNGHFIKFIRNPNNDGKKRQKTSTYDIHNILLFHKMDTLSPFCFFCGRTKDKLGENETLTIDHIKELNENGKDEIENLQILCSACHKLKNWATLYIRKHLVNKMVCFL